MRASERLLRTERGRRLLGNGGAVRRPQAERDGGLQWTAGGVHWTPPGWLVEALIALAVGLCGVPPVLAAWLLVRWLGGW